METINVSVRLHRVTKDDGQKALDSMEQIFDEYGVPDETRMTLWENYQVIASDVLIRFGELNPEIGYEEHNGHDG